MATLEQQAALLRLADVTAAEMEANAECLRRAPGVLDEPPRRAVWFIPFVRHPLKGGLRTIFTTAEFFSTEWETENLFVVDDFFAHLNVAAGEALCGALRTHFPHLRFELLRFRRSEDSLAKVPTADVAFCTLWPTAYLLLRFNRCIKKFYFMQDFEPAFYEAGTLYGAIEATYRFGFHCIANTAGVAETYERHCEPVMFFTPGVDRSIFFPPTARRLGQPHRVVFYGRPENARNGFVLGLESLRRVKATLGSDVDVVSVGADWTPRQFGVEGIITNLGLLPTLEAVAELYRSSTLGLVFMFTPHPSYQPLEYMACGCVTVTNKNRGTRWLLRDGENCLLVEPIPELVADRIVGALKDTEQLGSLRLAGLKSVEQLDWTSALQRIVRFVLTGTTA